MRVLFRQCHILDDTAVELGLLGVQVDCNSERSRWQRLWDLNFVLRKVVHAKDWKSLHLWWHLIRQIYCLFIHFVSCMVILYICTISAVDCSSSVNCSDCRWFGVHMIPEPATYKTGRNKAKNGRNHHLVHILHIYAVCRFGRFGAGKPGVHEGTGKNEILQLPSAIFFFFLKKKIIRRNVETRPLLFTGQ